MNEHEIFRNCKKALAAAGLALMLSVGAAAAGVYGWHNPLTEKPKGPFGTCWTFDRGNIDFGTNAPEIKVRYVLEGRNIPKGATRMASLGVDLSISTMTADSTF